MSSSTPSKRRGHHATKACNGCRRRRCKCDGVHPICGTCSFYGHECTWSQEEDARRPATKQLVESLRVRIRELEGEVNKLRGQLQDTGTNGEGLAVTRNSDGPSASGSDLDPAIKPSVKTEEDYPGKSLLTMQEGTISASGPTSMWSTFPVDDAPTTEHVTSVPELTYQFVFKKDPSVPPHMQPREVQLSDTCQWNRHLPSLGDVQLTRLEHDTLLDRYFNFHTVWLRTLVPELFLRDMLAQLTPQNTGVTAPARALSYTPFLHCALLSVAAAFSDDRSIRAREARDRFASCAKQWLESECESPTLTAIQALAFISDYHISYGERGLGYLFFGMSCRLTRALGLCIDAQPWVDEKRISPQELVLRDWQFWSTFCQDKIMSLDFGRDYDLPLPHLNVNLPAIDPEFDQRPWAPHLNQMLGDADKQQPTNGTLVFFETCKLMLIAVRIMDTVYSQGRQHWRVTEKDSVSQIHLLLDTWYNNLPEILVISSRSSVCPPPHVITMNITYWWLLMLLHRPFYARTQRSASNASSETPPSSFTDLSVKFCDRATTKIVQLISLFDQCHSLRQFPLNMLQVFFITGATLLVQSATLSGLAVKKRAEAYEAARKCIRALHVVGQTWACAELSANRLEALLREQTGEPSVPAAPLQPQDQPVSVDSSPMVYHPSLPGDNSNATGYNGVLSPSQMVPTMFREFVLSQRDDDSPLGYELPAATPQLQYPELHDLHRHPLMGMPSGEQFMTNPHILPLPYDPNFNESYSMGDNGGYYPH